MLFDKYVEVGWSPSNKKHYEKFGYKYTKQGEKFLVKQEELSEFSDVMIEYECDECNVLNRVKYKYYLKSHNRWNKDLCKRCSCKEKRNPSYNKDRKEITEYARKFLKQNPMKGKHHTKEAKMLMSKSKSNLISSGIFNIKSNNRGTKAYYFSSKNDEIFYCDSLLEKMRMIQLDNDKNIKSWSKKHNIKIPYIYNGTQKIYIPDFYIEYFNGDIIIEEIKGYVKDIDIIKMEYAIKWCSNIQYIYRFITQTELDINGEYRKFLKQEKETL